MGNLCGCCKPSDEDTVLTPDINQRRQLQQEAAERRMQENAARGVKNPARVARNQKKAEEMSNAVDQPGGGPTLRWQTS